MSNFDYRRRRPISLAQEHHSLITLIVIHLVLFVILYFVRVIYNFNVPNAEQAGLQFEQFFFSWFTLPAAAGDLLSRPWALVTHMFVHTGVWAVLGNVLWIWAFGFILQDLTGNRKIFPVFLYGAFAGALVYLLINNLVPALRINAPFHSFYGAGAGVMAIAAAATTITPGYRIFPMLNGGFPLWILTLIFVVINLATAPSENPGVYGLLIAGLITGYLYIYFFRKGIDLGGWMNNLYDKFMTMFNPPDSNGSKKFRDELFYKNNITPFKKSANVTEKRIDEILDKINAKGIQSLTEEERELLNRAVKE